MPSQWRMIQKLKRNWLVVLKLTWTAQNLTQALQKSSFFFNWLLVTKIYIVWATKIQRSYLSWHWGVMQILKKDWPVVWKKTRNLANFHQSTWKCQNWDFDGILLSKVEKIWAENLQSSYVSWQWRLMQNLKRSWLVVLNLTWGIWGILIRALESLK